MPGTHSAGRLVLSWPQVPGASRYRVQIAPDPEFQSFLLDTQLDVPRADLEAPADGVYWVRVRAVDGLGLEGHDAARPFTQHQLPAAPSAIEPSTGADVVADARFVWSAVGESADYRLQIARDPDFSQVVLERDAGNLTRVEIPGIDPGRYYWRVSAANGRGEWGEWSPGREYEQWKVSPTPYPPAVAGREMQLHWDPQEGLRYHLQIAREPGFSHPLIDETLDEPETSMARLRAGTYYARVQTVAQDDSKAPFGKALQFGVPVPLWIKLLGPVLVLVAALVQ
jgi:hypothetical protein